MRRTTAQPPPKCHDKFGPGRAWQLADGDVLSPKQQAGSKGGRGERVAHMAFPCDVWASAGLLNVPSATLGPAP